MMILTVHVGILWGIPSIMLFLLCPLPPLGHCITVIPLTALIPQKSKPHRYYYNGSPYLLNISFVPANNLSGTVTIDYTGYDTAGFSYSGKVQIKLSSTGGDTTPAQSGNLISSKYFQDVDISYSWAVPYIDSLYENGIISGSSSGSSKLYSPAANVTRGDFMLILYRLTI